MSSIGNRFFVSVLEDGTTLHGNLSIAHGTLTQAWNGTSAVPNWEVADYQPIIKLTLLNGVSSAQPEANYSWYYNGSQIDFNSSVFPNNAFQKTTVDGMPALKIVKNLAMSGNLDMDTIEFRGSYSGIDFSASIPIRISAITANGYLGTLAFVGGVSDITQDNQNITIYASLYGGENGSLIPKSNYSVQWYINEDPYSQADFSSDTHPTEYTDTQSVVHYALQVSENDIVDNAVIRCEFIKDGATKYNAITSIDDMQDPEFMYIQVKGANDNSAALRSGESVTFLFWVGKADDPTIDTRWQHCYLKLIDAENQVMYNAGLEVGIPDADQQTGWRNLETKKITTGADAGKFKIEIAFSTANDSDKGKKNLTGILKATT